MPQTASDRAAARSFMEHAIRIGKDRPIEGAVMLATSMMQRDPNDPLKMPYGRNAALAFAERFIPLTNQQRYAASLRLDD